MIHLTSTAIISWHMPPMDPIPGSPRPIPLEALNCRPTPAHHSSTPFIFTPPQGYHVAFHFPSPWYHRTGAPWRFDALIRPRPLFRTPMLRQKTDFHPTMGYRYKLEPEPSGGGVKAECLAMFTFPECGEVWPLGNHAGTFEFGLTSGNLVKGYRAQGAYKWRCYLASLIPKPPETCAQDQGGDIPEPLSAVMKLTPLSKKVHIQVKSCWVCPASGRSVRAISNNDGTSWHLYICDYL